MSRVTLGGAVFAMLLAAGVAARAGGAGMSANRTVWDGAYTEAQAARGKAAYEENCTFCHQSDLRGQSFAPPLIEEAFTDRWQPRTLGDLFKVVKVTMPQDKPGTLKDQDTADIVAYLLKMNMYPSGEQELGADAAVLKQITFARPNATAKP